ncbi:DHH family phosphoesterase [Haladaptatus sp. ZSTT2]|uniref:DHH family phosphoesterase n=1 Tax=Haladaptatus sp. ZSTT2 TaxID=3120515 RepID=UPI00300E9909
MTADLPSDGTKTEALVECLQSTDTLSIICHDNPDPDTLASALALGRVGAHAGVGSIRKLYRGDISHQQNRVFVNLLDIELDTYDVDDVGSMECVALVDSAGPGRNNGLEDNATVDIIIDHHVANTPDGPFRDVRSGYASTTEILVEHLRELEIKPHPRLATAMQFAIRQDTDDYLRQASSNMHEKAQYLHEFTDMELLQKMAKPPVSETTLAALGTAINTRTVRSSYLIANVGRITERDAVPQATDYLLQLEGVETVIVFGINGRKIHVSARSKDPRVQLGELLDEIFGDVGSAGGHDGMAAAQLPLGIFGDVSDYEDELILIADNLIEQRVFEATGHDNPYS